MSTLGKRAGGFEPATRLPKYCRGVLRRVVRAPGRLAPGIRGRSKSELVFQGPHTNRFSHSSNGRKCEEYETGHFGALRLCPRGQMSLGL